MDVKKQRKEMGLTQIDLSYQVGISRFRLFLLEKGYQKPSREEVQKLKIFFRNFSGVIK